MGRLIKNLAVMVQAGLELVGIGWVTRQDSVATDEAALHLVEPHDATKLDVFADFAFADDGSVGLKQADEFIASRDALPLKHPALGLAHDLLHAGHKARQLVG